ncbi:hypothetical protein CDAR_457041 [Caerostris darwini]|uniref:Uncharacterized protein n=1 Tax=Caerostris darwini TaxID=1538125 RepID=A0AAV4PWW2_9ARAC|nr:hypothetical protein CDAR_457041 [Caerostris darwini]
MLIKQFPSISKVKEGMILKADDAIGVSVSYRIRRKDATGGGPLQKKDTPPSNVRSRTHERAGQMCVSFRPIKSPKRIAYSIFFPPFHHKFDAKHPLSCEGRCVSFRR